MSQSYFFSSFFLPPASGCETRYQNVHQHTCLLVEPVMLSLDASRQYSTIGVDVEIETAPRT